MVNFIVIKFVVNRGTLLITPFVMIFDNCTLSRPKIQVKSQPFHFYVHWISYSVQISIPLEATSLVFLKQKNMLLHRFP